MSAHVVLSLGANLGDRLAALQGAVDALNATQGITVLAVSSVYATDPVGGPEQPEYANAVVIANTDLEPRELLAVAQGIEAEWDRVREVRWGPRTLDIDVIVFGELVSEDPELTVPHPRAHERGFVIVPWLSVEPEATLPGRGPIRELAVDTAGVRATRDILVLTVKP